MAKKKQKPTTMVLILDETGSMGPYVDTTLSGYNEYINGLRDEKISYTLIQFNSHKGAQIEIEDEPIEKVPELTINTYKPRHTTPLNDAVGRAIHLAAQKAGKNRVLLVVYTDGLENASKEYTQQQIFDLVEQKKKTGKWTFVFLGADIDAFSAGARYGVDPGNILQVKSGQEVQTMGRLGDATKRYSGGSYDTTSHFWSSPVVDEDDINNQ